MTKVIFVDEIWKTIRIYRPIFKFVGIDFVEICTDANTVFNTYDLSTPRSDRIGFMVYAVIIRKTPKDLGGYLLDEMYMDEMYHPMKKSDEIVLPNWSTWKINSPVESFDGASVTFDSESYYFHHFKRCDCVRGECTCWCEDNIERSDKDIEREIIANVRLVCLT